jgi:PAS domain S-box-containing protein
VSQVRQTAEESEARKRAIFESSLDGIITMDSHGRIQEFNPAAERIFGYAAEDVIGLDLAEAIVPPDLRDAHRMGLVRYLHDGEPHVLGSRIETLAQHADGSLIPVEVAVTRLDSVGEPMFTAHLRDITDRRKNEEELRASRARMLTAGMAERRRLERDLHDGAQQRLVALALDLRLARDVLDDDPESVGEMLEGAIKDLREAIDELRVLARGIHPAILTERGLVAALPELARRCPIPVELADVSDERMPPEVEATIYFLVAEALTNAVKYSGAKLIKLSVVRDTATVAITVADDGRGGADPTLGSGLRGMADRVAAVGGSIDLESPALGGTTIMVKVPCA